VNRKRVARVMRAHAIAGLRLRRRVRTTIPEPAEQQVADLLRRDFTAPAPNRRYVGDITYLPIADGSNLYLATVIDCFSRRLAGWAIAEHMRTDLVTAALAAARTRGARWLGPSSTPIKPTSGLSRGRAGIRCGAAFFS
jgi:transposase InsO family protein